MQRISTQALNFIYCAEATLLRNSTLPQQKYLDTTIMRLYRPALWTVEDARDYILKLESIAQYVYEQEPRNREYNNQKIKNNIQFDQELPVYNEVLEILPIFDYAVVLECHKPLVSPTDIPCLLYIMKIPNFNDGLVIENHGFGYHFHYGKVKKELLIRTTLLLTFPPTNELKENTLYAEYHTESKAKKIDIHLMGQNRKRPISLVCLEAAQKRGFHKFKRPGKDAAIFYTYSSP